MINRRRKYPENLKKIQFELPSDTWHGHSTENLWAEELSSGKYRIKNTPFFVKGISFEDIVSSAVRDGTLTFEKVLISGGHSTYRIILRDGIKHDAFVKSWMQIEKLGCSFESAHFGYDICAVDIPSNVDIKLVYHLLEKGENLDIWSFEEGHCGHII
jgi:hypothetical protein